MHIFDSIFSLMQSLSFAESTFDDMSDLRILQLVEHILVSDNVR